VPLYRADEAGAIARAAARLAAGEVVAFPTETVYGLGARADRDSAVARIFSLKGRPPDHPLIVHVAGIEGAEAFAASLPVSALRLMRRFWPGPLSVVVERRAGVALAASGGLPTIGLRCPDHPVASALLRAALALGVPGVAAPSANRFGRVSPTTAAHVADEFGPDLPVLDGGACREGIESTIVDCTADPPALLRPGTLDRRLLEELLGQALRERDADSPRVPGSLESHYAPGAALHLAAPAQLAAAVEAAVREVGAQRVGVYSRLTPALAPGVVFQPMPDNAAQAAHELFAALRQFDARGVAQIWVETPPSGPDWDGVRDRLQRAAVR
jgi:L-threonylcarbamoyladenylate synthase